ncbi:hypothetical protein GCM10010912_17230 [Paenibacillus albidus]|uniref:Uncharacterized protein n=1 Tax=Paenibacillus albidus TaxID=2041023 RepID=A0A917C536_9BACL|nr:hypothetical protein [Paenibacillus albidus]GGF72602.1 hypothetical protein GCM10010912_17230 [Paenibacillus albidus]
MLPVHLRLAEMYHMHKAGTLSDKHGKELQQCLAVNARYCWDYNTLNNQLVQAQTTQDTSWEVDIMVKMDWLRRSGKLVKGY